MITVEAKMYRATYDNVFIEDISDGVVSASVTADAGRDTTWTLDATLTIDGWNRLTPYVDWVAPVLRVSYPDGSIREGQLGLYLVMDSTETHNEISATVALDARDPLYLLSIQAFTDSVVIDENADRIDAVRSILRGSVLLESATGRPRYNLPNSNQKFERKREFPKKTNRLELVNDILFGTGYYPLWSTATGILTSGPRGKSRLKRRTPVRAFVANVPDSVNPYGLLAPIGGVASDIVGTVTTVPRSADMTNEILIINDDPHGNGVHVGVTLDSRDNKRSPRKKNESQRKRRKEYAATVDANSPATEIGKALLDELSTRNSVITFTAIPDPQTDFMRQVIDVYIYNASGTAIAADKYAVHSVTYGFTPSTALMQIECGLVQDIDDEQD